MLRVCALAATFLLFATSASAQAAPGQAPDRFAWMDQARRLPDLVRDTRHAPQWTPSGDRLLTWIETGSNAGTFAVIDAPTGALHVLLPPERLAGALVGLLGPGSVPLSNPRFTLRMDGHGVLFEHAGRTFALALDTGLLTLADLQALETRAFVEHGAMSPDGRFLALAEGDVITVTERDGGRRIVTQNTDPISWRLAEKPWSPDSRLLALWRDDASDVQRIPVLDVGGGAEKVTMAPYARTGTPLVRSMLHMFAPDTGLIIEQKTASGEDYGWLADWLPDSSAALVLRMARDGKRLDLMAHAGVSGQVRRLIRELRPKTFVAGLDFALEGWADQLVVMPDDRGLLWASERDNWRNYYRYDLEGRLRGNATPAGYPVHRIVGFIDEGRAVLAIASPKGAQPYDRLPIRFELGSAVATPLSQLPGIHAASLAPSARYLVDAWSSRDVPRRRVILDTAGDQRAIVSAADAGLLDTIRWQPPEGFSAQAADGQTVLHGVLFKPRDFDPSRRYAVIDYIYAGPFTISTPWNFLGNRETLEGRALAELGFIVAVIDGRGTPGRSKSFQDASYGRIGEIEIHDHVAMLRAAAAERPWMDLTRAGIVGHSWGGYFALRGMLTAPEFFHAGYAGAPGAVREDALVNEPYMGMPASNAEGYERASNERIASGLRGALKLMHGTADTSAPVSTTLRMTHALVEAGRPFELLLMPGEGHTPEGSAAEYYAHDIGRFFVNHLGGAR